MSYRSLLTRPVLAWCAVSAAARVPVAMAPLALVFLVRERPGGYSLGAVLAACYVVGEIAGAPLLGARLRPERARRQLAGGLAGGAAAFTGLGLPHGAHPVLLGALACVAGAAPAAAGGGMRALLTALVPPGAVTRAMSLESMLGSGVWAAAPAATTGLALGAAPYAPMLLAGGLMAASVAGLWLLPGGWAADDTDRGGASVTRLLARAWPVYLLGAASMTLLALAELVLPALLEQRGVAVGWAGPLLVGYALGMGVGAFLYGLRPWPGRLPVQGLVLLAGVTGCVLVLALAPSPAAVAAGLLVGGVLQAGVSLSRNLTLRQVLPPSVLAAGFSVMYASVGAGYAVTGALAGGLLRVAAPSTAILAGVGLTVLVAGVAAVAEHRTYRAAASSGPVQEPVSEAGPADSADPGAVARKVRR
ncbi:MFS transporter [Streptomyces sp. LP05-1]|uniref:MFS transporter n=1 Tax=Streptomyces pyxinae TaxID=2970734 RepID=A0ABT2CGQ4_9ACTN|nr:MFS transporter [Streptomyces sp. LP05-1]MCS0635896.1 MFS transporter [Streptomyces sp. LP05-1]